MKADAAHRIRETGWLKAWRGDAVAAAKQEQALLAEYGIASELLDRQAHLRARAGHRARL